jgi:hypothetical protein
MMFNWNTCIKKSFIIWILFDDILFFEILVFQFLAYEKFSLNQSYSPAFIRSQESVHIFICWK